MFGTKQLCTDEHPMLVLQSLSECIPTSNGADWVRWFKSPTPEVPSFDIRSYTGDNFRDEYLFAELFSKYDSLPLNVDKRAAAIESFIGRERANQKINADMKNLYLPVQDSRFPRIMRRHRHIIRRVLGSFSKHSMSLAGEAYFGPGVNIGIKFGKSSLYDKVSSKLTCTEELAPYALSLINENDFLARALIGADGPVSLIVNPVVTTPGAKLSFVPKNAKTDRSITVEPAFNSFIQNGLGKIMRRLISRRTTLNLSDQHRNQMYAKIAKNACLATVDLKDASNSLTYGLVQNSLSLCKGWFHILDMTRSKRYVCKSIDDKVHSFEMFSGMGNGFTFPLESLIFYALAKATCIELGSPVDPVVYGDDIIIPVHVVPLFTELLRTVGLDMNANKTFSDGVFRESCGKHYYRSTDVTPIYVRSKPENALWYFTVHNNLWRWACRDGVWFDSRVLKTMSLIRELCYAPFVHPDLGDVGYFPLTDYRTRTGLGRWKVTVAKTDTFHYKGSKGYWCAMHQALSSVGSERPSFGKFSRRSGNTELRRQSVLYNDYIFPYVIV